MGTELLDVTVGAKYQNFLRQRLREMEAQGRSAGALTSNGYLGGWVAAKALVGELEEAWRVMLATYDRQSDWPLKECLVDVPLDECPADKTQQIGFPDALAKHLIKHNYITENQAGSLPMILTDASSDQPTGIANLINVCVSSSDTLKEILLRFLTGGRLAVAPLSGYVTFDDDFTVNANNPTINKVVCAVTAEIDVRRIVGKVAENGDMRSANVLNNMVRGQGAVFSRRLSYTVQPTSKAGQVWVELAPFR